MNSKDKSWFWWFFLGVASYAVAIISLDAHLFESHKGLSTSDGTAAVEPPRPSPRFDFVPVVTKAYDVYAGGRTILGPMAFNGGQHLHLHFKSTLPVRLFMFNETWHRQLAEGTIQPRADSALCASADVLEVSLDCDIGLADNYIIVIDDEREKPSGAGTLFASVAAHFGIGSSDDLSRATSINHVQMTAYDYRCVENCPPP